MKKYCILVTAALFFTTAVAAQTANHRNRLNFDDVEVLSIIKLMSKATGKSFVFNNRVLKGKRITILSDQTFTPTEAYRIFEAFLHINNLSTIVDGKIVRIVPSKEAKIHPTAVYDGKLKIADGTFITRVIPVKNSNVKTLRSNLAPLISKNALLLAISDLNAFIMRDTKENTSQFAKLVQMFDKMDDPILGVNLEIIPVKNASATELAALIMKVFATVIPKGSTRLNKLHISSDKRTNSIIVIGQPASVSKVKKLLHQLDKKEKVDLESISILSLDINIIPIKNGNVGSIASLLGKIFALSPTGKTKTAASAPQIKVFPYERTNQLLVVAHPKVLKKITEVVQLLDTAEESDHESLRILSMNLEIVPIQYADATGIADLITRMLASPATDARKGVAQSPSRLKILSDKRTNNLILIGPPKTIVKVKQIIAQLDVDLDAGELAHKGNIRVYKLKNSNAKKISEVLQKVSKTFQTPPTGDKNRQASGGNSAIMIIPDIPTNSLVIYADNRNFKELEGVLQELDIARPQVFIQALIMEVKLDKSLELGVEWQTSVLDNVGKRDSVVTVGGVGSTGGPKQLRTGASGAVIGVLGSPIQFGGKSYASFDAFIRAYEKDNAIDILSNPKILTLNNEEAEIKVAEIIPTTASTKTDSDTGDVTRTIVEDQAAN